MCLVTFTHAIYDIECGHILLILRIIFDSDSAL